MVKRKHKKPLNQTDVQIGGMHIYVDEKGRYVYYNVFDKNGYVMDGYEKQYRTYSSRFILGIVAGLFATLFDLPVILCIAIGIAGYLIMEFRFRKFLRSVPRITNFKPQKRTGAIARESSQDAWKILLKAGLFLLLGVLLVVNAYMEKYTDGMLYMNWLIAAIVIFMAGLEVRAYFTKQKQ